MSSLPFPLESATLIDVRTPQEYQMGYFPNAINIDYTMIHQLPILISDKNAPIYLYCRSGRRSEVAKNELLQLGYQHVYNLGGLAQMAQLFSSQEQEAN